MKEFEIQPLRTPPIEWNFEEIKAELTAEMKKYSSLVYTDDTIKEAKQDRAFLRKVGKTIQEKKIAVKREYCAPYETFENQVKELIAIVEDTANSIDGAVKDYEARKRAEKEEQIRAEYEQIFAEWKDDIPFEMIRNPRWLNASVPLYEAVNEMKSKAITIRNDLSYIGTLDPSKRLMARFEYLRTLKLSEALASVKERLDWEKKQKAEEWDDDPGTPLAQLYKYEVTIRVVVTDELLDDLLVFMKEKGIELVL